MILLAPSMPVLLLSLLEEFGIRCVEVSHRLGSTQDRVKIASEAVASTFGAESTRRSSRCNCKEWRMNLATLVCGMSNDKTGF